MASFLTPGTLPALPGGKIIRGCSLVRGSSTTGTTVCLAAFNDRLASLFDTAMSLEVYVRQEDGPVHKGRVLLPGRDPYFRVRALLACRVDVLICGAISSRQFRLLMQSGITVLPWYRGTLAEVLEAWCASDLDRLAMPGCRPDKNTPGATQPSPAAEPEKT